MRCLGFALLALFVNQTFAQESTYDQKLAVSLAQAYVESYLRLHPHSPTVGLNWEHPQIHFVPRPTGSSQGYIAVFFPDKAGPGAGHAYFEWTSTPGHIFVISWGWTASLTEDISNFSQAAANGSLAGALFHPEDTADR